MSEWFCPLLKIEAFEKRGKHFLIKVLVTLKKGHTNFQTLKLCNLAEFCNLESFKI